MTDDILDVTPSRSMLVLKFAFLCIFLCGLLAMAVFADRAKIDLMQKIIPAIALLYGATQLYEVIRALRLRPVWFQLTPTGLTFPENDLVPWEDLQQIKWAFGRQALLFRNINGRRWHLHRIDINGADMDRIIAFLKRWAPQHLTARL